MNGIFGQETYSLGEMPRLLFCLFSFVKITEYDEPWAFKPWASGLAGFPFAFVCLGTPEVSLKGSSCRSRGRGPAAAAASKGRGWVSGLR